MPVKAKKITLLALLMALLPAILPAQPSRIPVGYAMSADDVNAVLREAEIENGVRFLSDTLCGGRASGSYGAVEAASWIARQFSDAGLMQMNGNYLHGFSIGVASGAVLPTPPRMRSLGFGAQSTAVASYSLEIPRTVEFTPSKPSPNSLPDVFGKIFGRKAGLMKAQAVANLPEIAAMANGFASRPSSPVPVVYCGGASSEIEVSRIPCHNIVGFLPGWSDNYVIIAAHYDNIGILSGKMYPGADSNASGVVSMLALARLFKNVNNLGKTYSKNIIFVALDGKQHSMAGAENLWGSIESGQLRNPVSGDRVTRDKVSMFINLDIMGAVSSPIHKGRNDYLLMLSTDRDRHLRSMRECNRNYNFYMDLAFDYYGSKGFTDMFLNRVSEQKVFIEHGIPSIMFTSGITMQTNKAEDTPETVDFEILGKRVGLIFRWLDKYIAEF